MASAHRRASRGSVGSTGSARSASRGGGGGGGGGGASHRDGPHSVPFIVPESAEEGARFTVTKEALELLSRIKVPVAPVAVVGKYRTGKSFLLNKLLRATHAFEVGPTIEACTKGIWLWSEPLYLTLHDGVQYAVLFVDTECVVQRGRAPRGQRGLLIIGGLPGGRGTSARRQR
jgi:hypothetical protein